MNTIKRYATRAAAAAGVLLPGAALAQSTDVDSTFGLDYGVNASDRILGTRDIRATIFAIINVILGFLGIIAVIIILYGGFMWMTSQGNEDKTGQARKLILAGVVGLIIILASLAISRFVVEQLSDATGAVV